MLAKKYQPPLIAELKPSTRLKRLTALAHLLALGASAANALPMAVKIALGMAIGLHFRDMFKKLDSVHQAIKHTDALGWELADGGDFEPATILKSTVVTTFAVWLHIEGQHSGRLFNANKRTVLIMNDALTDDLYRQLIARLKTTVSE